MTLNLEKTVYFHVFTTFHWPDCGCLVVDPDQIVSIYFDLTDFCTIRRVSPSICVVLFICTRDHTQGKMNNTVISHLMKKINYLQHPKCAVVNMLLSMCYFQPRNNDMANYTIYAHNPTDLYIFYSTFGVKCFLNIY